MSERSVTVVWLDSPEGESSGLAKTVTRWLLKEGVIQTNSKWDAVRDPSEWMPGPRWRAVVEEGPYNEVFPASANNGVGIEVNRQVHHPVETYEPPLCGSCSAVLPVDVHHGTIETWLARQEPIVVCPNCGWSAPIGDWPAEWGFAIGEPAVVFNNWPDLKGCFLAELRTLLGGRTLVVRGQI